MGYRLSKIATRTGDDGTTGLGDGSRTHKGGPRIQAIGEVDELNSTIGLLLTEELPEAVRTQLLAIQQDLFDLGGELCIPGFENVRDSQVAQLDAWLESHNAALPRLQEFVLPGGSRAAAFAHLARTVCRRAERAVVALGRAETVRPTCRQYLNRLSDLMFVLARVLNRHAGVGDVMWQKDQASRAASR
ncbi:MAG: cob(I)yrinic acid a,c-diamide adenosyltransferase [Burkholderiales bacterium]|nr:cob(I)yrinic acid a,c-diamide adenosyltransferase [Burkholderiales bacterium]OJX06741.1 MAG: ATP:cob(I)alamin adenosyltransferase [Burkholderiales bacterium 70-64]